MASSRPSTSATTGRSMSAMARGVKAPAMIRRTRVCSGGSLKTRLVVWCSKSRLSPYFGRELALLVRGIGARVLVDRHAVGIAGQEVAAVGEAVHRGVLAQRVIGGIGVGVVVRRQPPQIEGLCNFPRLGRGRRSGAAYAGSVCRPAGHFPRIPRATPAAIAKPPNCCRTAGGSKAAQGIGVAVGRARPIGRSRSSTPGHCASLGSCGPCRNQPFP